MLMTPLYGEFKIMGGGNLSKYYVSTEDETGTWNNKIGFLGGIGLERAFSTNFIFEFDFLFFQKGSRVKYSDTEAKYSLNIVSIPVLLKNKFSYGSSPYILGGVEQLSRNTNAKPSKYYS